MLATRRMCRNSLSHNKPWPEEPLARPLTREMDPLTAEDILLIQTLPEVLDIPLTSIIAIMEGALGWLCVSATETALFGSNCSSSGMVTKDICSNRRPTSASNSNASNNTTATSLPRKGLPRRCTSLHRLHGSPYFSLQVRNCCPLLQTRSPIWAMLTTRKCLCL